MSRAKRPLLDAARLVLLISLSALLQWAAAGDSPAASDLPAVAEPLPNVVPRTVEDYLAVFNLAYLPPAFEQESLYAAESASSAAQQALLPRATLKERLVWDDFSALDLEFGLDLVVPLHSSLAPLRRELAGINVESRRLALEVARADARASLLLELANLATLDWVRRLATDAMIIFEQRAQAWQDGSLGHSGYVPPGEREAFERYLKLRDAAAYFAEQSEAGAQRLGRSLALPSEDLPIPPLSAIEEFLASVAQPLPTPQACLATSVHSRQASLRSKAGALDDELRSRSEFTIALTADLGYALPSLPTTGHRTATNGASGAAGAGDTAELNAALALEARILVPDGWPLAGSSEIVVSPQRSAQSLELSWPPLPTPRVVVSDRAEDLDNELQDLEAELLALRAAWSQAVSDRELLERRLSWAILDAAPEQTTESLSSRLEEAIKHPNLYFMGPPTGGTSGDPEAASASVEIRLQHAFARVAEASARARYLAACGRL